MSSLSPVGDRVAQIIDELFEKYSLAYGEKLNLELDEAVADANSFITNNVEAIQNDFTAFCKAEKNNLANRVEEIVQEHKNEIKKQHEHYLNQTNILIAVITTIIVVMLTWGINSYIDYKLIQSEYRIQLKFDTINKQLEQTQKELKLAKVN